MRSELQNPKEFQQREKFLREHKYAVIICNEDYGKVPLMGNLQAVNDDL